MNVNGRNLGVPMLACLFTMIVMDARGDEQGGSKISLASRSPISAASIGVNSFRGGGDFSMKSTSIGGVRFSTGIGVEANSWLAYPLEGGYSQFEAYVGISTQAGPFYEGKRVVFSVTADGETLFETPPLSSGDPPVRVMANLSGRQLLVIQSSATVTDGLDPRLAIWADAYLEPASVNAAPAAVSEPTLTEYQGIMGSVKIAALGRGGLMISEIDLAKEFISNDHFPLGSMLIILRIGEGYASDLTSELSKVIGHSGEVSTYMHTSTPPYRVWGMRIDKIAHVLLASPPSVRKFFHTVHTPTLSALDIREIEDFLTGPGKMPGDRLLLFKRGRDKAVDWDARVLCPMPECRKEYRLKHEKPSPALDVESELTALVAGRASVVSMGAILGDMGHTIYGIERK